MRMNSPAVKLVCFDLGGVVLRICRSWAEGCRAAGLDVRLQADLLHEQPEMFSDINDAHQRGRISLAEYAERFSEIIDGVYSPGEIMQIHAAWILGEYDGISRIVISIHDAGLTTAVLSNTNHAHWRSIVNYPTVMRLRHHLGSHELGLRKPEPAAYLAVQEKTGFSGGEILFFDDLPENIAAARRLGWRADLIDPLNSPPEQIAGVLRDCGIAC